MEFKNTLAVLFILWAVQSFAQPFDIGAHGIDNKISLTHYAQVSDVGDKVFTIEGLRAAETELRFNPLETEAPKISFTNHHYWVKLGLKNSSGEKQEIFLETGRAITDEVDLYIVSSDGKIQVKHSGDIIPFNQRELNHRKNIFPLILKEGEEQTLYIHYKSDGEALNLPLILHSSKGIVAETASNHLFYGLFYGVLLLAAIIYLFFYVGLRDRSFLYYGAYVILVLLLQFSLDGLFFQHIMPNGGWLYQRSLILFAALTAFFLTKYVESFLAIKQWFTQLPKIFNVFYVLQGLVILLPFAGSKGLQYAYPFVNAVSLLSLLLIISAIVWLYFRRQKIDIFFSIGVSFLVLGYVIFIMNNFGVLDNSFVAENSSKIGTGLEVIFLSLSMSNRIRKLRSEKEEMQGVALKRSEEMNEMKSYFMSNMSHELRTPLNAIMGIADVMAKEVKDEGIKSKFEVIKYASVSLLSSVNDILDYSKIEKGELNLEMEVFDPTKILEQIRNNFALQASDKGLQFYYQSAHNMQRQIRGDAMRLGQIVNNVVSNAIKFTSHGEVKFSVACVPAKGNSIKLVITVSDTGVGIPKEKLDIVFNSFSQESIDNKRKFGGLGLGLAIVKKLVDLHGGEISIESTVGKGTLCSITIPYEVVEEKPAAKATAPKEGFDLGGAKILVVEDNDVNQFIMNTILSRWKNTGFSIVGNGEEALEALKNGHYDIILMDLQMPVMDGYEATECIRRGEAGEKYSNIPIIAVTADTTESTKATVKEIGINEYMAKPIDQAGLYEMILELVEQPA